MMYDGRTITKFLIPGDLVVSRGPAVYKTVLGSCIALCIHDCKLKSGGMNHFIYAESHNKVKSDSYGDVSCDKLIREMIKSGSKKEDLRVRIIGGASSHNGTQIYSPGISNIAIVKKVLKNWEIPIMEEDLGGSYGRTLVFITESNKVIVKKLSNPMRSFSSDKKCDINNQ